MQQRSVRLLRDDGARQPDRRAPAGSASTMEMKSFKSSNSSSSSLVVKRKVDELFRRLQPHMLVQSTEKLLSTLKLSPKLFVNGEELIPKAPPAHTIAAAAAASGAQRPASTTAGWRFRPNAGRFRYGLSLQYTLTDKELSLSSLEDLRVLIASTAMQRPRELRLVRGSAPKAKDWRLVAETEDPRIGLALYDLALGDWVASSLVALVWTQKREIARLFLQLHTTEMLYSAPKRSLPFRCDDDLDKKHGLYSYTAAISLRSLDELYWEHEVYQIEFPSPQQRTRSVTVHLLDDVLGGTVAARERVVAPDSEPSLKIETEAVKFAMSNCLMVDFTLWDSECVPVWGFSRALEVAAVSSGQLNDEDDGVDLSVSAMGGTKKRFLVQFEDSTGSKKLAISLTKVFPPTKKPRIWVSQVDLTLSLDFINTTFGTRY